MGPWVLLVGVGVGSEYPGPATDVVSEHGGTRRPRVYALETERCLAGSIHSGRILARHKKPVNEFAIQPDPFGPRPRVM